MRNYLAVVSAVLTFLGVSKAFAGQPITITAATGGSSISADTAGGTYTTLTGPIFAEGGPGGISQGTIILNVPSGFVFDPSANVSVGITGSGSGPDIILLSTNAVVDSSSITITVASNSTQSRRTTLTFRGIKVRPSTGRAATGSIIESGTATYATSSTNYGVLTIVSGAVSKMYVTLPGETFTSGLGNSGTVTDQAAGTAFNISNLRAVDQYTNLVTTYTGSKTISYSGPGGTATYTTAVSFSGGVSTTTLATTLRRAETTTITATDGTLTGIASSPITVTAGPINRLQILLPGETSNAGSTTGKTGTPTATAAFSPVTATVNVADANWNPLSSSDTVHFVSSDSLAVLPANTALTNGTGSFSIIFKTRTNNTSVTVSDVTTGSVSNSTSTAITVTNNAPDLTSINTLTGALEDTTLTISYATLLAQATVSDIDVNPTDSISFRVEAISTGTLTQGGTNVLAGSTFLRSNTPALIWRGATNANGTLSAFTVKAYDGSAFSSPATQVSVTTTAVNDAPSFTKGANQTVFEDSGLQTIAGWATSISAGPTDESAQTVSLVVTNNNNALFASQPAVASNGTLTFTPANNAVGTATVTIYAQDNGGTANGGSDSSATQTFTITITGVNDAPSFTKGTNVIAFEDSGAKTITGWATAISAGPPDEASQTLTFTASNDNNSLFSVQPTVSTNGTLTFTPAANANGSATVTLTLKDNGGVANSGSDTSAAQTFTITVTAVNDAPSFTKGANQTVFEDSGARSVSGWATAISKGPSDESSQTVSFVLTNNNTALFSVQPAVSTTGTLTFTPAADAVGIATVTTYAQDDGGTANGGQDASTNQTFTITITGVNDAPSFTKGTNVIGFEDTGAQTITGWASGISAGPADESSQTLTFTANNNNNSLFSVQPAVSTNGTLTFTPAANANGSATITLTLKDNGGVANSGIDTSAAQTFTITVNAVNDAPSFTKGADQTVLEDSNTRTVSGWATAISKGPSDESSQTISFIVSNDNNTLFSTQPAVSATGVLTFKPAANANGSATVTVYAQDNGGTADGAQDTSASQTFVINVTAVNDPPSFTTDSDINVFEDSGAQSFPGWATSISAGPSNESGQTLTFTVSNNNSNLFNVQPSVAANGTLTFTPTPDVNGSAIVTITLRDDGGTANSGNDTSATQTFTITVSGLNDAPTLDPISDVTVLEDSGVTTILLTGISAGSDEPDQSIIDFSAIASDTNLLRNLSVSFTNGNSTALLRFTPVTNANGNATITVTLQDDGGTGGSGVDQTTRSFNVSITPVNDKPAFTKGSDLFVRTTIVPQIFANWATGISAGPTDESTQSLTFHLSNDNNAMFLVQPSISANGTLTFTALANGTANVSVYLQDNGGTANSGSDSTAVQTFTIVVYPVNIAPSFWIATNLTVLEDSGAQTLSNWATNIVAGPADESSQVLSFIVTNTDNSLFTVQPAIDRNGTLTFTPAPDAYGSAVVTVVLNDNGDTAFGGSNTSAAQTFVLNITGINDAPSFTKGLDIGIAVTSSRTQTLGAWATGITPGANESSQTLTFVLTNDTPEAFTQQPAISTDGTLTFTISPTVTNVLSTVSVRLQDDGGTANGGINSSAVQTFRISLSTTYGGSSTLSMGQGPTGLYLGNLRGLTFPGATKSGGPRYRDMIVASYLDNTISIRFCNDDGTFTDAITYPVGLNPFGVTSADLNKDGFDEIIVANYGTNTISVLLDQTDRTFASAVNYQVGSSANPGPISVTWNDFNGDGKMDVVVANSNDDSVSVLLGLGNGTLGNATNFSVGSGPMSVWTGDFNGDKNIDIVTANKNANTLTILPGLGNGNFGPAQTISLGSNSQPTYVSAGDLNGDRKLDLVVANYASNTVSVLLGQGNGNFQVSSNYLVGINPQSTLVRDLDRDGKIDIAVANTGSSSISILRNRGDGTFDYAGNFTVGSNPLIVWGSNFDSDDATDLAISNFGDNTISIMRYAGPLAYSAQLSILEDHSIPVTLTGRVLDNGALAYAVIASPLHGTLTGTAPNLTYTPDANYNGTDSFRFQVTYTTGGLIFDSASATVTIKISAVNDAPSFALSTTALSLTNFNLLQTNLSFATAIAAGPTNESYQQISFSVTTTNSSLFDVQPKLTTNGVLTFRPGANKSGIAYCRVRLTDTGGTASGGTNASPYQAFTITIYPNPLIPIKGIYNGLFYEASGIANNSAGFVNFTLSDRRTFTGRLLQSGKTYSLNGTFATNGVAQLTIPRTNQSSLTLTLNADLTGHADDQMTGTVSDGVWISDLLLNRNVYAATNPAPKVGRYTMAFGGNPGNIYKPAGDGVGVVMVRADGTATLSGTLSDGSTVSPSVPISKKGTWPLYTSLYNGNGLIAGWVTFTNTVDTDFEGDINWIKTGAVGGKYYPNGFTNEIVTVGSAYLAPSAGTRVLSLTNGFVELRDGNISLSRLITNRITLNTNNVFTVSSNTNNMSLAVTPTTGLLSGSFVNPQTKQRSSIRGAVLQKQNAAYGFFLGTNQSGLFILHP